MKPHRGIAVFCLAGLSLASVLGSAFANETCYGWATELVIEAQDCVSSVLPPQMGINYGPDVLSKQEGAWCEGVPGYGNGEWIEIRFRPDRFFQSIYLVNGYAKSAETFLNNSRVKQFKINTSDGLVTIANLQDHSREQIIRLPRKVKASSIRLTIIDVYRGAKYADTCLSKLVVDIEEYQR